MADASAEWFDSLPSATPAPAAAPAATAPAQSSKAEWFDTLPVSAPAANGNATPATGDQSPSVLADMAKQVPSGAIRGAVGFAALPLNLASLAQHPASWLADKAANAVRPLIGKEPLTPEQSAAADAEFHIPSTNELIAKTGLLPEAQTIPGQYVDTGMQFVAGGPGKILTKIGAALTSETAGQLTKGTSLEPYARIAGGVAGGAGAAGAQEAVSSVKGAAQKAGYLGGAKEDIPNAVNPKEPIAANPVQMNLAAQAVRNAATDPAALETALQQPIQKPLGLTPTLAEAVPDQGIAQAQNAIRAQRPEPFQASDAARTDAIATTLDAMSQQGNPANISDFIRRQIANENAGADARDAQLSGVAAGKMSAIGQYGQEPETNVQPDLISNARAVRKGVAAQQYSILDRVNNEPGDMVTPRNAAQDIVNGAQQYGAAPLGKTVQGVVGDLLNPPQTADDSVQTLRLFRSRISAAQRSLSPDERQDMARLQTLKQSVDQGLQNTVEGLALRNEAFYNDLLKEREQFNAQSSQKAVSEQPPAGQNAATGLRGNAPGQAGVLSGVSGTEGEANAQSANANGSESVPGNFGPKELQQYKTANQTYARNRTLDDLENSGAVDPNGQINVRKFNDKWLAKPRNIQRLNADPQFRDQLTDAKQAQQALDEYRAQRVDAQSAFQKSRLGKFIEPNAEPSALIGKIFREQTSDSAKVFRELTDKIRTDPDALAGWRAATSKYINDEVANATLAPGVKGIEGRVGKPMALRDFIQQNKFALREIYGNGQGLQNLEQVAAAIRRNQQFEQSANIKGQSNTAKNLAQIARNAKENTLYELIGKAVKGGGAAIGAHVAGPGGAFVGEVLGDQLSSALKSGRFDTVKKIELAMYADPEFAQTMLTRFGAEKPPVPLLRRAGMQIMRVVPAAVSTAQKPQQNQ